MRSSKIERETNETDIKIELTLDGKGDSSIDTSIKFLDHLINSIAKHAMFDLKINARSKDNIIHHLIEDTAIALGLAIDQALDDRKGIARFGYAIIPMDESLAKASIDLVKRSYYKLSLDIERDEIEGIAREDMIHFFESLLKNVNACIHIIVEYGSNDHHKVEAAAKAFAIALKQAIKVEHDNIPSTKGVM
ncbi:MAG: imidazoleglycerol-phosphate dehydratase HisB [Candidatus Nitrosothermus koennekii]|nr:MAG: imidazoleglycerol-phosphate dehydratase HisB [Candidatus Nitrosothermus koennekii]